MKRLVFAVLFCMVSLMAMPQPHHRHRRVPCATSEQMGLVMSTLKKQSFDDQKLEISKLCVSLGTFCVSDLSRMAEVFSFDDNRLEFLKFAYDYCSDPENYPMLKDSFSFSSNYDKLMEYVYPAMRR